LRQVKLTDGRVVMVHNTKSRAVLEVRVSLDDGLTWHKTMTLEQGEYRYKCVTLAGLGVAHTLQIRHTRWAWRCTRVTNMSHSLGMALHTRYKYVTLAGLGVAHARGAHRRFIIWIGFPCNPVKSRENTPIPFFQFPLNSIKSPLKRL
jgi:hypothetical protein